MIKPTILLSPIKASIPAQGGTLEVMVRVQAPDQASDPRNKLTPKRLALVIDRSGSMDGQPLAEALKCVEHIANCMTSEDQLSVVAYDNEVRVLMPLTPCKSASAVKQAIAGITSRGTTNLFGGWEEGAKQLETGLDNSISRVILLSDGQANFGLVELPVIEQHCRDWLAKGVSTTTVGLGRSFNEDLMIGMSVAGGGRQYYGQTAADLYDSFDEEFSLLQALCLRQMDLKIIPAKGVVAEPLGVVQKIQTDVYRLSDLAWGTEAWMVLRLHISAGKTGEVQDLLAVSLQANTLDSQPVSAHSGLLSLPVVDKAVFEQQTLDADVMRRLEEVEFAQASQSLRKMILGGDFAGAKAMMDNLQKRYGNHPWLQAKLERMRHLAEQDAEMLNKEISFSQMKMSTRLTQKGELLYAQDETDSGMPAFLRKKVEEGRGRQGRFDPK